MNTIKRGVLTDLTPYKKGRKRRKRRHIKSEILKILEAYKKGELVRLVTAIKRDFADITDPIKRAFFYFLHTIKKGLFRLFGLYKKRASTELKHHLVRLRNAPPSQSQKVTPRSPGI